MHAEKTLVALDGLRNLAHIAKRNGTQDAFIDMALEWAEAANREIALLKVARDLPPLSGPPSDALLDLMPGGGWRGAQRVAWDKVREEIIRHYKL